LPPRDLRGEETGVLRELLQFFAQVRVDAKRGTVARISLPPDANCLLSVADHCLRSRSYVTLIVIDKQPQLHYTGHGRGDRALPARRLGLAVDQ
jgi:phosphoketolase